MALASTQKLRGWIGLSAGEAVARFALQVIVTAVLARLLAPEEFGTAALALTIVAFLSVGVGTPYEEAIAQRRVIRRDDLEAALATSYLAAIAGILLATAAGYGMAVWLSSEIFQILLPVTAVLLLAQAPLTIAVAVARRRRAFGVINLAVLVGNVVGAIAAIAAGLAGFGIWALVAFRVVTVFVTAIMLSGLLGLFLWPRMKPGGIGELGSFARYILMARALENLTYLLFNTLVGHYFGLTALGMVNMALRIVEPVRGAVAAIGHNLSFSLFKAARGDDRRMRESISAASAQTAILTAPVFMGLASISPILIPLLAGSGWEGAAEIASFLALGGMLLMPSQTLIAAMTVQGRPADALYVNIIGIVVLTLLLMSGIGGDPIVVGAARLGADAAQLVAVIAFGYFGLGLHPRPLLEGLLAPWGAAIAMALGVTAVAGLLPATIPAAFQLVLLAGLGAILYGFGLFLVARERLRALIEVLLRSGRGEDRLAKEVAP